MNAIRLLRQLISSSRLHKADATSQAIDDALEINVKRFQAIDPETDEQWRRIKIALESAHRTPLRQTYFKRVLLNPVSSIAVATVALIIIGAVWLSYPSSKIYDTSRGEHSAITLTDSTEVILNHTSELTVSRSPFEHTRRVALKGEAYFHVRRNGTPFIVSTDVGSVQVLGTQFNIRARDGQMEVAVMSGSVKVRISKDGADSSIVLTKGQIIVCTKNNFRGVPGTLPFAEYPGWIQGKLTFYRTRLFTACMELESQFDISIKIENPSLREETITGAIDSRKVIDAMATLAQLTGHKYRYENGSYSIY